MNYCSQQSGREYNWASYLWHVFETRVYAYLTYIHARIIYFVIYF